MRIFWHVIRADFFSHWEQKGPGQGQPLRWKKKTVLDLPATFSLPCQASSLTHTSFSSLLLQNAASRLFSPSSLALQVCFELTDDPPLCDSSTSLLSYSSVAAPVVLYACFLRLTFFYSISAMALICFLAFWQPKRSSKDPIYDSLIHIIGKSIFSKSMHCWSH